MKILNVVKTNEGAGWAYRHVEWIKNNCEGYEFVNVLPSQDGGFAEDYKALGCKVIGFDMSLPVKTPWRFFKVKKQIRRIVEEEKPDLIHSHFVTTTLMLRLALGKKTVKRIFQVPGPLHLESPFFRLVDKFTANGNDYFVGACKWTCNMYKKMGIPEDHIFLDYYGGYPKMVDESGKKLHDEYNISVDTPLVGMVSYFYAPKYYLLQFQGIKGHEDFINAIALVRQVKPDVVGVIVGSAWGKKAEKYEQRVKSFAEKKCPGGIIFTGRRNDVQEIYHEFSVAVHPSHSENVGGAGESLSRSVPTISTNVGGFPDCVIDGVTGWTVDKSSPKQLAEKILWTIDNPEASKKMAKKGKELCESSFNITITASHMVDIYNMIANN